MDKNGVKITFIETQFVTSDAASFKSVVQRLTGNSTAPATRPLHRPRPRRAAPDGRTSVAGPQSCYVSSSVVSVATAAGVAGRAAPPSAPCQLEELHEIRDFSEMLYVGASERRHDGDGSYNGLPY